MNAPAMTPKWYVAVILVGRLFAGVFAMAASYKFADMNGTAGYIAAVGFPFPLLLAWPYVLFLALAFHGPAQWNPDDQTKFGFFVNHFTFIAGLLFAAVHGPGSVLALRKWVIART